MSPLDDELRTLLASRAAQVAPSPDPLAGIEARAGRIRRHRLAGAALASVIVLTGAGLALPALVPDRDSGATQFATQQPSPETLALSSWPTRGAATPEALAFVKASYGPSGGPGPGEVFVRLLWGGSPDNGPQVVICVAGQVDAEGRQTPRDIVLASYAEDGDKQLIGTEAIAEDARQITRVVDVGSGPYVVAVGEPGTRQIAYAAAGGDEFLVQQQAAGVATFARTGPTGSDPDLVRYTFADGTQKTVEAGPPEAIAASATQLDPANPWAYRGDQAVVDGLLPELQREWAVRHPGSTVTPLFGQDDEPARTRELAFVATGRGENRWGYARASEVAGTQIVVDEVLDGKPSILMAALPGDEVPRLFVLASPSTGDLAYAKDYRDDRDFRTVVGPAPGVGYQPLEGDTSNDAVRVLDGDGDLDKPVFLGPAPDAAGSGDGGARPSTTPDNLLSWPGRGATPPPDFREAWLSSYAKGVGAKRSEVEGKVLFYGDDDSSNRFLVGQAWTGDQAHTVGYSVNGKGEATPFLGRITDKGTPVLAMVVAPGTGQSTETLVVVPQPAVKKTYYGAPQSEWIEIVGQDYLEGVTLIDRRPGTQDDLLKLETASGQKVFEGKIFPLLCGLKGCG